jgi:hypothetical protein
LPVKAGGKDLGGAAIPQQEQLNNTLIATNGALETGQKAARDTQRRSPAAACELDSSDRRFRCR